VAAASPCTVPESSGQEKLPAARVRSADRADHRQVAGKARTAPGTEQSSHEAVQALLRRSAAPGDVEIIETHMSWVYLVGDEVLKLKKPVRHAYPDFTTLSARETACREEVRLNARLAPGVYRGVMALQQQGSAHVLLSPALVDRRTKVADWLVCMKRLPHERMLDVAMAQAAVQPRDVEDLVRVLADFYLAATRVGVSPAVYLERARHELDLCREVLLHPRWMVAGASEVIARLQDALTCHQEALSQRALQGRIVDGHGDLRPEHVCLLQPPVIIDCIEFNAVLRQLDPFDELAFLALECRMAGADWIGARLIKGCAQELGDRPPAAVLQIYTAHRALVRARLSLAHLFDPQPRTPGRWLPQTHRYLAQARAALQALPISPQERALAPPSGPY
jgi:uncharacterized protein